MERKHSLHGITLVSLFFVGIVCVFAMRLQGIDLASKQAEYAQKLFDTSRVHSIDLQVQDAQAFFLEANEQYVPCTITIDGEVFPGVGLRVKGNNSRRLTSEYGLYRHSMKVEFDQYHHGLSYYGLDKFSLDASFQDNSYMKTYLAYDMMRYMGVSSPLASYAMVTVNGRTWGLFLAVEEPEEAFARRNYGIDHGLLYKPEYRSLNEENADVGLCYIDNDPQSYPGIFENAKFPVARSDQLRLIESLRVLSRGEDLASVVDVDACLRYFAVQVFLMNPDSYLGHTGHNYFLYEQDGVITILPWDYNLAFGTYCLGMTDPIRDAKVIINYPIYTPWTGAVMKKRPLYHNLMQNDAYFIKYQTYLSQFVQQYVQSGRASRFIEETVQMIGPYVQQDVTAFCSYEDFILAADTLDLFCLLRAESVLGQLAGKYPATHRQREENSFGAVDAAALDLFALGDFADLEAAQERQYNAFLRLAS